MPTLTQIRHARQGGNDEEDRPGPVEPIKLFLPPNILSVDFMRVDPADATGDRVLTQPLYNHGFNLHDVLGDGNCGFYCCLIGLAIVDKWKYHLLLKSGMKQMFQLRKRLKKYLSKEGPKMIERGGGMNTELGMSNFAYLCCDTEQLQEVTENTCKGSTQLYYTKEGIYDPDEQFCDRVHAYAIAAMYRVVIVSYNVRKDLCGIKWSYTVYDGYNAVPGEYAQVYAGFDVSFTNAEDAEANYRPFFIPQSQSKNRLFQYFV